MRNGTGMFALTSLPRCATRWLIERALPRFPDTLVPRAIHGIVTPEMVIDEVEASGAARVALVGGGGRSLKECFIRLRARWPKMKWGLLVRDPADNVRSMVAHHRAGNSMLECKFPSPLRDDVLAFQFAVLAARQMDIFLREVRDARISLAIWRYPRYTTIEGMRELAGWAGLDPSGVEAAVAMAPFNMSKSVVTLLPETREGVRQIFYARPSLRDVYCGKVTGEGEP